MGLIDGEISRGRSDNCTGDSTYKPIENVGNTPHFALCHFRKWNT